jgi:hypothetical protein
MSNIRQVTAETVEDAVRWINTTQHHIGSWIRAPGFFVLQGYHDLLRVPEDMWPKVTKLIQPAGSLDARMFCLTKSSKNRLRRAEAFASDHLTRAQSAKGRI